MKYLLFVLSLFISLPIAAQHWAAIGKFNHGIVSFFNDTIDDKLYLAGGFSMFNSDTIPGVGSWNGTNFNTFGCGIGWDCTSSIIPDGFYPGVMGVTRYDNDIYVAGAFTIASGVTVNSITRWNGSNWESFGRGLKSKDGSLGIANGIKVINNDLYVFGVFDSIDGIPVNSVAKYNGINWSAVNNFPLISSITGGVNMIYDVAIYNNELYVCGNFYSYALGIYRITKWDGTNWVSVGNGIRGSVVDVRKMLVYKNELIVAGRFSKSVDPNNPGENIGKWNGTQWTELGTGTDDIIDDIKIQHDTLYACGAFSHAGGIPADEIARWDGTKWCGYGTHFDNVVGALEFYRDTL